MIERGKCIILSAPSGSGKTTLVKHLLSFKNLNLVFSISATNREKRIDESQGKDYLFVNKKEFKKMIVDDEFIEFEEVYKGIFYGSLKKSVNDLLNKHNVIFDIDVEGGIKLKKFFKSDAMSVFDNPVVFKEKNKSVEMFPICVVIYALIDCCVASDVAESDAKLSSSNTS